MRVSKVDWYLYINHIMHDKMSVALGNSREFEKLVPLLSCITVEQQVPDDSFDFSHYLPLDGMINIPIIGYLSSMGMLGKTRLDSIFFSQIT